MLQTLVVAVLSPTIVVTDCVTGAMAGSEYTSKYRVIRPGNQTANTNNTIDKRGLTYNWRVDYWDNDDCSGDIYEYRSDSWDTDNCHDFVDRCLSFKITTVPSQSGSEMWIWNVDGCVDGFEEEAYDPGDIYHCFKRDLEVEVSWKIIW
ncbi:hypothetical protein V1524DRAFT_444221 [Lipomyces starkeyi]